MSKNPMSPDICCFTPDLHLFPIYINRVNIVRIRTIVSQ